MKNGVFVLFILAFFFSCNKTQNVEKEEGDGETLILSPISDSDTACLSEMIDTIIYVALDCPKINGIIQAYYCNNRIIINDTREVLIFDSNGKLQHTIPLERGSIDLLADSAFIYTYQFLDKRLSLYTFSGEKQWERKVKSKNEIGYMGYYFSVISDTTFVIANINTGGNLYRLSMINNLGGIIKNFNNDEKFTPEAGCYTTNSVWKRLLYRVNENVHFHPFWGDTVFLIQNHQLQPIIIEHLVDKVPLQNRTEYKGWSTQHFREYCQTEKKYATRFFETSRYIIVEYKLGSLINSISNYWIYDKQKKKLCRTYNDLENSLMNSNKLHLGILNDYDGGLAFQPMHQTDDYLIMVDAGESQGGMYTNPSELYKNGRIIKGKMYSCRSDSYLDAEYQEKVSTFFEKEKNDNKTVLTIVRLRK